MDTSQVIIAFASMLVLVIFLERSEKWMSDLRASKAQADRQHSDHGV